MNKQFRFASLGLIASIVLMGFLMTWTARAYGPDDPVPPGSSGKVLDINGKVENTGAPQSVDDVIALIKKLVLILSRIFWIAAVGFILWAAFVYLQAGGDSSKVKEATDRLKYAIIAIVIALLAGVLPALIQDILK